MLNSLTPLDKGFLAPVFGARRKVSGYRLSKSWPPEPSFFQSGPVGFVYFAPMWFRYYVSEHISKVMAQIETKDTMLQLDHVGPMPVNRRLSPYDDSRHSSDAIPHTDGNFIDQNGRSWAADTELMSLQVDVSKMTDQWVKGTQDRLFRNMTVAERSLLQMVFSKEFNV